MKTDDSLTSESVAAALKILKEFTVCFNARDLAGTDACLHFPHIILNGPEVIVWDTPGRLPAHFFEELHAKSGWSQSIYTKRMAILGTSEKVHFLIGYTRNRGDGSVISTHENLWIVTNERGKVGD